MEHAEGRPRCFRFLTKELRVELASNAAMYEDCIWSYEEEAAAFQSLLNLSFFAVTVVPPACIF